MRWLTFTLSLLALCACSLDKVAGEDGGSTLCGNGIIDPGEGCDPNKLGAGGELARGPIFRLEKCHKGTLTCDSECNVPVDACQEYCGDGEVNGDEDCDGQDFAVACVVGEFKCNLDCTLDRSQCTAWCGDGVITSPEQCEPILPLPNNACYDGKASCKADCSFDLLACNAFCGDEVINGDEDCDGAALPSSCHDDSGVLSCTPTCTLKPGGCTSYCGDGKINGKHEECDGAAMPKDLCNKATCQPDCYIDDSKC